MAVTVGADSTPGRWGMPSGGAQRAVSGNGFVDTADVINGELMTGSTTGDGRVVVTYPV